MKLEVLYHVIYGLDIHKGYEHTITYCKPSIVKYPLFKVTETEVEDIDYIKTHRKYVGILNARQLVAFIDAIDAYDTVDTMGALTLEYGMLPAINFETETFHYGYSQYAYVSPVFSETTENYMDSILSDMPMGYAERIVKHSIHPLMNTQMEKLSTLLEVEEDEHESLYDAGERHLTPAFVNLNQYCLPLEM